MTESDSSCGYQTKKYALHTPQMLIQTGNFDGQPSNQVKPFIKVINYFDRAIGR